MKRFYSNEVPESDVIKWNLGNNERFEFQFFTIPFGMKAGTVVKLLDGKIAGGITNILF